MLTATLIVLTTETRLLFSKRKYLHFYNNMYRLRFPRRGGRRPAGHEYLNFMTSVDDYNAI